MKDERRFGTPSPITRQESWKRLPGKDYVYCGLYRALRDKAPNLSAVRKACFCGLDEWMYVILKDTLPSQCKPADIESLTWKATYYEKLHNAKQKEMKVHKKGGNHR